MKAVKYIIINLLVLITMLVMIDPWLDSSRYWSSRNVRLREPSPNQDSFLELSQFLLEQSQGLEPETKVRLRTNDQGFYIGENSRSVTDSVDVMFFGGSTTECLYVDEDKRFPYLVGEKLIDKNTNQNIVTLNGGLRGNNSIHSLVNLIAKGIPLKPKIVVFMHNVNDLSQLEKTGSYWISPNNRSIIVNDIDQDRIGYRITQFGKSVKDLLFPNIYQKVNNLVISYRKNDPEYRDEWQYIKRQNDQDIIQSLIAYERGIRSFVNVAKIHGIKVILMTQFNRLNPNDAFSRSLYDADFDQLCKNYRRFNEKIKEISLSENVHLIDLSNEVPSNSTYIYDMVHLNNTGSEYVADLIAQELIRINPNYHLISN